MDSILLFCVNRLTDVTDSDDDPVASYYYDYAGRRVKKVVYGSPNVITKYTYDGYQVLCEYDEYDNGKTIYIYGPGIDEPIFILNWCGYYLYHFDGLGNVAALTDESGNIVERYEYDVFGRCTVHTSPGADGEWMTDDGTYRYYYDCENRSVLQKQKRL